MMACSLVPPTLQRHMYSCLHVVSFVVALESAVELMTVISFFLYFHYICQVFECKEITQADDQSLSESSETFVKDSPH